jgi:hypothetical protein
MGRAVAALTLSHALLSSEFVAGDDFDRFRERINVDACVPQALAARRVAGLTVKARADSFSVSPQTFKPRLTSGAFLMARAYGTGTGDGITSNHAP